MTQAETDDKESLKTRHSRGSRRPSVDTLADGRSITSQSDTRSYREKLKDRINIVKERAGVSAVSTQKGLKYIQKTSSKNALLGRITDMLLKEEADVKEALERHAKSKLQKKQENTGTEDANGKLKEMQHEQDIRYETSIEFFTKVWKSPEENTSSESALNSPRKETENVALLNNGNEDGIKILAADYLGLKETIMEPVEFKTAQLTDDEQRKNKMKDVLFYTTLEPTELQRQQNENKATRIVKDEGFFVPSRPKVKATNMTRMHQRLYNENNRFEFT
ncbi:uncharacterized protein LOC135836949 [Planococcus citri]|uniref:uncharacterized protein LOC135836949 n=1 Tax=Planococcus citri TaxID=170843 RepID=UPI0031F8F391